MSDAKRLFTLRDCLHHILGDALAESIIADQGAHWATVAAMADLNIKRAEGRMFDHIDRLFIAMMDRDAGRIDEGQFFQAAEEFRQDHRAAQAAVNL